MPHGSTPYGRRAFLIQQSRKFASNRCCIRTWLFHILAAAALAGCGGEGGGGGSVGGGDGGAGTQPDPGPTLNEHPNILLVISDDLGLDASSGYQVGTELPTTPTLDELAANGLIFDNAWASPLCSPTRATILTGRYGIRTGVLAPDNPISLMETSLQSFIDSNVPNTYTHAVIGKWHLFGPDNGGIDNPNLMGIDHFAGFRGGGVADYFDWTLIENGRTSPRDTYTTTAFVDLAMDWIAAQEEPWFAWLAFNAPHTPFHLPPLELHDRDSLSPDQQAIDRDPLSYYLAAIEAMDRELGRLLDSFSADTRANTVIIYMGDNGTPRRVYQGPVRTRGKGSVYQGGVAVPMIISGRGVSRTGEREDALVSSVDLFATIANLAGAGTTEFNDSLSFADLLSDAGPGPRSYAYTEVVIEDVNRDEWAIRNDRYKLMRQLPRREELYDLQEDPMEQENLLLTGSNVEAILAELRGQLSMIRE